jgi:ATPase family AAA domain-containing protein 3A/B
VRIRKLKAEAEQKRKRNIAAINAVANHLGDSFLSATKNPRQVILLLWYLTILATGIFTAREMAKFCRVVIESLLQKPKLIRETSRKSLAYHYFVDLLQWFHQIIIGTKGVKETRKNLEDIFEDVALPKSLKDRILTLATAASKSRENDAPHRHILFFGKPGTGKTLVARKLSQCIGMEYAIMSGGDVGPLGVDAVTQIHSLFRWSKLCRKGVILFIDEAEAFLANRNTNTMSENAHNALNALLYNTGTERKDFMMILATNR